MGQAEVVQARVVMAPVVQDLVVLVRVVLVPVTVPEAVVPVVETIAVPVRMKSCHCAMLSVLATTSTSVQQNRVPLLVVRA